MSSDALSSLSRLMDFVMPSRARSNLSMKLHVETGKHQCFATVKNPLCCGSSRNRGQPRDDSSMAARSGARDRVSHAASSNGSYLHHHQSHHNLHHCHHKSKPLLPPSSTCTAAISPTCSAHNPCRPSPRHTIRSTVSLTLRHNRLQPRTCTCKVKADCSTHPPA